MDDYKTASNISILREIKKNSIAFYVYVNQELENDREFILKAVKYNGLVLQYVKIKFINHREIELEAVKNNGDALKYISQELINDKEIVLEAVKQNGLALRFVSEKLKNREIILEAVKKKYLALQFISKEFLNDEEIILEAVKQNGLALYFVSQELLDNIDIIKNALENIFPNEKLNINENIDEKKLNLKIIKINGEIIEIELDNDKYLTLDFLKYKIEKIIEIEPFKQELVLNTHILTNIAMFPGNLLKKYNIQPKINLIILNNFN